MKNPRPMKLAAAAGVLIALLSMSASSYAASLHQASNGSSGVVTGALPGEVLWTDYQTLYEGKLTNPNGSVSPLFTRSFENIIRLVNPNGAANGNLAGAKTETVCAMIYVFDDQQEMGECCGCPLSSGGLATFAVTKNLISNWSINSPDVASHLGIGSIAIVAAAPNGPANTCNPTNVPGYSVTTASNLLGSLTRSPVACQAFEDITPTGFSGVDVNFVNSGISGAVGCDSNLTETALFDDAGGDPTNLIYLQTQCGAIVGNSSGSGVCNCPIE